MKFIAILLIFLAGSIATIAQPEKNDFKESKEKESKASISLAKQDAEGNITENVKVFAPKDIPILCYVDLKTSDSVLVKLNFVAVKVKGIRPNSKIITTSYKTKGGEDGVTFTGKPEKTWFEGNYRVDIFLDGILTVSKEFLVQKPSKKPD